MTKPFVQASCYIVIKRSDIAAYPEDTKKLVEALPQRNAVVVEADWPEFNPIWNTVDDLVTGGTSTNAEPNAKSRGDLVEKLNRLMAILNSAHMTQQENWKAACFAQVDRLVREIVRDYGGATHPRTPEPRERGDSEGCVACACGDFYPASSFGAGFIAAAGHCENCEAAAHVVSTVADSPVGKCGVSSKSEGLQVPDECDSPVLCKLNRACAGQLGTKKQCGTHLQATRKTAIELARQAGLVTVPNSKPISVQGLFSELETLIQLVRNEAMDEAKQAVAALDCPTDEDNFEAGCMYSMHVIDKLKS